MSIKVYPHHMFLKIGPYTMYYTRNDSDIICDVPAIKKDD
jgi:hypothetical protein